MAAPTPDASTAAYTYSVVPGTAASDTVFGTTDTSTTVKTPKGTSVPATKRTTELTAAQIAANTSSWRTSTPRATLHRSSTRKYNCHSYAWYSTVSANNIWINSPNEDKYWTDGSYRLNSNVGQAGRKVSYSKDDHSAITINATEFYSKCGPVGPHAPRLQLHALRLRTPQVLQPRLTEPALARAGSADRLGQVVVLTARPGQQGVDLDHAGLLQQLDRSVDEVEEARGGIAGLLPCPVGVRLHDLGVAPVV